MTEPISAETLLQAYAYGVFPMAEDADDDRLFWVDPKERGVIPLSEFHVPRRLRKTIRKNPFSVRVDSAFRSVMRHCAKPGQNRERTWINEPILELYGDLFDQGFAHSVECYDKGELVGGLYGVSIGAAFFGESMFSLRTDASKIALVHLVARLIACGYKLLDAQFLTDHLSQFGAREIPREEYRALLKKAIAQRADFYSIPPVMDGAEAMQLITQTS